MILSHNHLITQYILLPPPARSTYDLPYDHDGNKQSRLTSISGDCTIRDERLHGESDGERLIEK